MLQSHQRDELWDDRDGRINARKVVGEAMGLLIGSFPNTAPHSPKVYTAMLIEEHFSNAPLRLSRSAQARHALQRCCCLGARPASS
jgi:hypothetical protein